MELLNPRKNSIFAVLQMTLLLFKEKSIPIPATVAPICLICSKSTRMKKIGKVELYWTNSITNFAVINERCDQAETHDKKRTKYFSIVLCGAAGQFYFEYSKGKCLSLTKLAEKVNSRFQTSERTRALLLEWSSLILPLIMK